MAHKRKVLNTPAPTEDTLFEQISNMQEPYRSYTAFTYLMGTRCAEPLGKKNTTDVGNYQYIRKNKRTKKTLAVTIKKQIIDKNAGWKYPPLTRDKIREDVGWLVVRDIPVFKRTDRFLGEKYVDATQSSEKRFINILDEYLATKSPGSVLWEFSRHTAYRKIRAATGLFPHKLRSMRATKDVVSYGLDVMDLQRKFGWTQITMPLQYVNLNTTDIKSKIRKNAPQKDDLGIGVNSTVRGDDYKPPTA